MLVVLLIVALVWLYIRNQNVYTYSTLIIIGLIISFIVAVLASLPPITEIPIDDNQSLRVFSPIAYPFSIQQFRDYTNHLFSYSLILGWPQGISLLQYETWDDQSEFINLAHYTIGLHLGLILLLGMSFLVLALYVIDKKYPSKGSNKQISKLMLIAPFQFAILSLLFLGNPVYSIGIIVVFVISLIPVFRDTLQIPKENTSEGIG